MQKSFWVLIAMTVLVACAAPVTQAPTQPSIAATSTPGAGAPACNATYQVPGDTFRSDDPAKLDAGNKPKLVEFFAYW